MKKFHKFKFIKGYCSKDVYIRLDTIVTVFENNANSKHTITVIHTINGHIFQVEESLDEVMKLLENQGVKA